MGRLPGAGGSYAEEEEEDDYDPSWDDEDEAEPTCDHCGGEEEPGTEDWNPETGNHKSCDYKDIMEKTLEAL